jgi:hypothetical protein
MKKIVVAQVIGNVKDERCFFTLSFMKSKLHNRLIDHLDLAMCMFAQKKIMLNNFTYNDAFLFRRKLRNNMIITHEVLCLIFVICLTMVVCFRFFVIVGDMCYLHQLFGSKFAIVIWILFKLLALGGWIVGH